MMKCVSMRLSKIRSHGQLMNRLFNSTNINRCSSKSLVEQIDDCTKVANLNVAKRSQTAFCGACILTCTGARLLDFIATDLCLSCILACSVVTISVHLFTIMYNNVIGFVYLRNSDESVILSYNNYWGERVDLKTDIHSILPLSETSLNLFSNSYRILNIKSCKEKLKLTKHGQILQEEDFINIFGMQY